MATAIPLIGVTAIALLAPAVPAYADDIAPHVWRAYRTAIEDARTGRDPVVDSLVTLTRKDRRVQWRTIEGRRYVLVTTLRRNALTDAAPGQAFQMTSAKWVTVPKQLRSRCARIKCSTMGPARLDLTLKQFLGVPPDADYQVVNTFWARPRDMFRPCRRPSVRATSCPRRVTRQLPLVRRLFLREQKAYAWRMPTRWDPATAVSCASSWPEPDNCYGFPWTRLGYTYDWAPQRTKVGLTEFVVKSGSTVYLHNVTTQRALVKHPAA